MFQYAGAKHVALERLRDNLGQREEVIVERMHQDAAEAEQRLDEEADKLEEAQEKFDQAREEWRKLLVGPQGCASPLLLTCSLGGRGGGTGRGRQLGGCPSPP